MIEELRAQKPRGENGVDLAHLMELLESRLALAIKEADDEIEVFQNGDTDPKTWTEQVRRLAKRMHESRHLRLIESGQLLELIERALELIDAHGGAAQAADPARRARPTTASAWRIPMCG